MGGAVRALEDPVRYVCALTLRAAGTSCPLTASPTVGRASSAGPEQCQKKKRLS